MERQNRDRRLVGKGKHRYRRGARRRLGGARPFAEQDAVGAHRPCDVLDLLLAPVLECKVELVANLVAHDPADADATRLGQRFEAGGDVDAVAEDVAFIDDDVADIDADAELDAPIGRYANVAVGHLALNVDRAAHRVDDAGELD